MYTLITRAPNPENPADCRSQVIERFVVASDAIEAGWKLQKKGDYRPFDVHTDAGTIYWAWELRDRLPGESAESFRSRGGAA